MKRRLPRRESEKEIQGRETRKKKIKMIMILIKSTMISKFKIKLI